MVKIVYSPRESLEIAGSNTDKQVVFFGVGFETTIPAIALTLKEAHEKNLANFSILSALWIIPPPLRAIVETKEIAIDGFLYPGHVSAIIGAKPYQFIAEEFGIPGANEYARVVRASGNPKALAVMEEMLETKDSYWRGLGLIPQSGLKIREEYSAFDAEIRFNLNIKGGSGDLPGCRCGEILQGLISPPQCPLFVEKCNPDSPYGPCMVSFEGACFVYYKYNPTIKGKS
jgi:hydrogenase expression/formation protein HypD